jgi:hypothetical protein
VLSIIESSLEFLHAVLGRDRVPESRGREKEEREGGRDGIEVIC